MKILVADDGRVSLRMMQRTLQQSGYKVITAQDGREAAHLLCRPDGPRLALIDWMMPQLDGPGVCAEVRRKRDSSYVYIVMLTAKQSSDDIVRGLRAGADDYLTKPCNAAELQARLHTGRRILQLEDKLVEAREQMRYKATHDALTSLWDRSAILTLLRNELYRSIRENTSVSLLLCDVDHFKQVNDTYGHLTGDEILRGVAGRLTEAVRLHDAVGRYGGEEFLIVLSGCSRDDLSYRAEEIREAINKAPFCTESGEIAASLSIGAITVEGWDPSCRIENALNQVDQALYRAKAAGRNRVAYSELPTGVILQKPGKYLSAILG